MRTTAHYDPQTQVKNYSFFFAFSYSFSNLQMLEKVIILYEYSFYNVIQGQFPLPNVFKKLTPSLFLITLTFSQGKYKTLHPIVRNNNKSTLFTRGERTLSLGISSYFQRLLKVFHKAIVKFWIPTPHILGVKYKRIKINLEICKIQSLRCFLQLAEATNT